MTSLGLALDLPKAAREQKVGKIARILGTLRDLDVLGQVLTTDYQPHLPKSEAQILAEVIEVLTTQRQEAFKKVKECLHDRLYLNFKQDLNTWLEKPIYQPIGQILLSTVLPDLLLPQASRLLLHPGWLVGIDCQKTDIETLLQKQGIVLHELRKEAKRSRYNMELFTEFYGDIYQTYLRDIKEIQTVLGEIQDGLILAKFLTTVRGKNWKATMPTLVQKFQDIRALKWQEWQLLQHKFLQPQNRKEFHLSILNCS
jgi:CHAD domain-containing protein